MLPILYSYRRCPYAMRARMVLEYAGIKVEHREIELRSKPTSMLRVSPKGTVPVLCLDDLILEESLDIMHWALRRSDPDGWGDVDPLLAQSWIAKNDGPFKLLLDQYKYPERYPHLQQVETLSAACKVMLEPLENALRSSLYVMGNNISWVDVAIFPFVRQFARVDQNRFEELPFVAVKNWLHQQLGSPLFKAIMVKHPTWKD